MSDAKGPAWLRTHVRTCRAAFGLDHPGFDFSLILIDQIGDDPDTAGETTTSVRYARAGVTLRRTIRPDAWGYEVVTHELLHAATGAMRQAIDRIIDLVPAAQRRHAEELWMDGNEATITQLARGLTPILRAAAPPEDTP